MITTSPTPWHALANGEVRDYLGNSIGFFRDPRNADLACGEATQRELELEEELKDTHGDLVEAEGYIHNLEKVFSEIETTLDHSASKTDHEKLEAIKKIVDDYETSDPTKGKR